MKKFPQYSEFSLGVIAAIVLTLAQLGAMHHAYSHVPQVAASVGDNPASHALCDDCLSFAPLLTAAASPTVQSFVAPPMRASALRAVAAAQFIYPLNLAFRSRAPPVAA